MDTVRHNNHRKAQMRVAAQAYRDGDLKAALRLYQRLLKGQPNDPAILFYIGNVYRQQGKLMPAAKAYRKALSLDPNFFEALLNLAIVLRKSGSFQQALKVIRQALHLRPESAQALNSAGTIYYKLGKRKIALQYYQKAIERSPDFPEAHYNAGNIYKKNGMLDAAEASYREALGIKPDFYQAINSLGNLYRIQGRNQKAMQAYEKSIAVKPDYVQAYRNIAVIRQFSQEDQIICGMKSLIANPRSNNTDRISLNFSLGKAYEDLKQYDVAFAYLAEGNRLKRSMFKYNRSENEILFDKIKKVFTPTFFKKKSKCGVDDTTPIFVVGMPRSGTSMVEQILASHPDVYGAGELSTLDQIVTAYGNKNAKKPYPTFLKDISDKDFSDMGTAYIESVRNKDRRAIFITDKMPQNFLFVGLIKIIMPKATIIHCVRNPLDTCLSIFKNDFTHLHRYAYDLMEIGHYYQLYRGLMQDWHDKLPKFIHDFHYEDLVTDPEHQVRKLLHCCDLEWNDQCLLFHESSRPVMTASTAQIRKPFYRDSINLWKEYKNQLLPLFPYFFNNRDI